MKRNLYGFRFLLPKKEVKLWQKQDELTKQKGECYNGRGRNTERRGCKIVGYRGDLPTQCDKPNSRWDLYDKNSKIRIQSRWFNANGVVKRNRDFEHQNAHNNHKFPHDHEWDILGEEILPNGEIKYFVFRHKENLDPDYALYNSDEVE